MKINELEKILAVTLTVNGTPYTYEAHSAQKVAEIIASTVNIMRSTDKIDSIQVHIQ